MLKRSFIFSCSLSVLAAALSQGSWAMPGDEDNNDRPSSSLKRSAHVSFSSAQAINFSDFQAINLSDFQAINPTSPLAPLNNPAMPLESKKDFLISCLERLQDFSPEDLGIIETRLGDILAQEANEAANLQALGDAADRMPIFESEDQTPLSMDPLPSYSHRLTELLGIPAKDIRTGALLDFFHDPLETMTERLHALKESGIPSKEKSNILEGLIKNSDRPLGDRLDALMAWSAPQKKKDDILSSWWNYKEMYSPADQRRLEKMYSPTPAVIFSAPRVEKDREDGGMDNAIATLEGIIQNPETDIKTLQSALKELNDLTNDDKEEQWKDVENARKYIQILATNPRMQTEIRQKAETYMNALNTLDIPTPKKNEVLSSWWTTKDGYVETYKKILAGQQDSDSPQNFDAHSEDKDLELELAYLNDFIENPDFLRSFGYHTDTAQENLQQDSDTYQIEDEANHFISEKFGEGLEAYDIFNAMDDSMSDELKELIMTKLADFIS